MLHQAKDVGTISIYILQTYLFLRFYIVELTCGQTSSENCTYFVSSGSEAGACRITICPCNDNICQIRLDFATFVINGPSTSMIH